eukprot:10639421-Alexandrium_andersonii.AAC.1
MCRHRLASRKWRWLAKSQNAPLGARAGTGWRVTTGVGSWLQRGCPAWCPRGIPLEAFERLLG